MVLIQTITEAKELHKPPNFFSSAKVADPDKA